jgi:hypothetical protein
MKKIIKLTESDLMRIVKRVINEEKDNMIKIPKDYKGVRKVLRKFSTPEDIMSEYNYRVDEATPLVSYSIDGFFVDENGEYIEVEVVLDDLEYSITGGDKGEEDGINWDHYGWSDDK